MAPRELRQYQVDAANAVESAWDDGLNRVSVVLPTGSGKSAPHSTPVVTPDGTRFHGDLCVGDRVFHQSGKPTRITHIHPQGVMDVWRVSFSDGTSVRVSKDHLWHVWRRHRKPRVMSTGELLKSPLIDVGDGGMYMWRIPMTRPLTYPERELPIAPYTLGALIANGHTVPHIPSGITITTPDIEVHARVISEYPKARLFEYSYGVPFLGFTHHPEIVAGIRSLGLNVYSADKFIPREYLTASVPQRLDLLHGLMDGDGSSRGGGRRAVNYHTTSTQLAKDVQQLVWTLGGNAQINSVERPQRNSDETYTEYTIHILMPSDISPWFSSRKVRDEQPRKVFEPRRSIVSIEYAGKEECQCITVENPDGLYLVGEELIVTHNSTVIAEVATRARRENKKVLLLAHRTELLDQMADAVKAVDPSGQDVGIVAADRDEHTPDIVAASFQTLARGSKRLAALGRRDVILADECHHISAPTYLKVLEDLNAMDDSSGVTSCGFTATMYRDDGKHLGDVWKDVVFERDLMWAISNGFLIAPKGKTVAVEGLNRLATIKTVAGDYKQNELAEVMSASVDSTVDAVLRHCPTAAMIVFAVGVEHAQILAEKLTANGIASRDVTGAHKRDYREEAYKDFREGRLNCLVTVQVLTEGADFPRCDTVVLARPTRSKVLLTQVIGRSVRPYTDPVTGVVKTDATVLDLTGVVRDVKLASLTDLFPEAEHRFFDESGADKTDDEEFMDELLGRAPVGKERKGRIDLEDVDLIDNSMKSHKALWLRTGPVNAEGDDFAFMPLKNSGEYIFIYPQINRVGADLVMLGKVFKNGATAFVTDPMGNPLKGTLTQAMDAAEAMATGNYIGVKAGWRRSNIEPSEAQLNLGRNLGIPGVEGLSRGELSDAISVRFAQRMFADIARTYPYPSLQSRQEYHVP